MRVDRLWNVFAAASVVYAASECAVQAWVRAPDLAPGTVVQGDVRVKLAAACTAVESASLGLRFRERSFVKASRSTEATKRPTEHGELIDIFDQESTSPSSPWVLPVHVEINCSNHIAFKEIAHNKKLWFVRDEERIVFESTQAIDMGESQAGVVRDVVQEFAVLVPSTNFPPALDYPHSKMVRKEEEFVNVESIYEYFVRVAFTNRTTAETSAGFTAFHPIYDPPNFNPARETAGVQLELKDSLDGSFLDSDPVANYTVQITCGYVGHDGFAFSQGAKDQFVQASVTRTGRARTFVEPLKLHLCLDSTLTPKWSSEYTSDPSLQSIHRPSHVLRATSTDFNTTTPKSTIRCLSLGEAYMPPKQLIMPNATADQIATGEIVSTTSLATEFHIDPDPRQLTDFETYYHTQGSVLSVLLEVERTADDPANPKTDLLERRAVRKRAPAFEPDEEDWVPWYSVPEVAQYWRGTWQYTGRLSVSVSTKPARAPPGDWMAQVVMGTKSGDGNAEPEYEGVPAVHYLSEGARAPTLVDGHATAVRELLAKTPAERDLLAPLLDPVVSSPPEGEERVHRYYRVPKGQRPSIYVGETWVKR